MIRDDPRIPQQLVRLLSSQQTKVTDIPLMGDVHRVPDTEGAELVPLKGFLASTDHVLSDEVSPENQEVRNDYFSISPELGYAPQPLSSHPARRGRNERFESHA